MNFDRVGLTTGRWIGLSNIMIRIANWSDRSSRRKLKDTSINSNSKHSFHHRMTGNGYLLSSTSK